MQDTTTLVAGINHVALVVRDLDRWVEFWTSLLDVEYEPLPDTHGSRHGLLQVGGASGVSALHAFEITEAFTGAFASDIFRRGRIDHLAIAASGEAALVAIRDRLVARSASDGSMRLFPGGVLSIHGVDPEGMDFEIACVRSGDVLRESDYEVFAL